MNELPIEGFLLGPPHRNDEHLLYTPFSFLRPSATRLTIKLIRHLETIDDPRPCGDMDGGKGPTSILWPPKSERRESPKIRPLRFYEGRRYQPSSALVCISLLIHSVQKFLFNSVLV